MNNEVVVKLYEVVFITLFACVQDFSINEHNQSSCKFSFFFFTKKSNPKNYLKDNYFAIINESSSPNQVDSRLLKSATVRSIGFVCCKHMFAMQHGGREARTQCEELFIVKDFVGDRSLGVVNDKYSG